MPSVPQAARMPKGLTDEEKKEYQRERNRLKQANLRARRAAKLKEDRSELTTQPRPRRPTITSIGPSSISVPSTSDSLTALPSPADSGTGPSMALTGKQRERVHFDALMRAQGGNGELKAVVARLVYKLVEVGVDDRTIERLLDCRASSSGTESPSSSLTESPLDGQDPLPVCSFAQQEEFKQQLSFLDLLASASSSACTLDLDLNTHLSPLPSAANPISNSAMPTWDNAVFVSNNSQSASATSNPLHSRLSLFDTYPSPGPLDVESLRLALNLTQQPIPSSFPCSAASPSNLFCSHSSDTFFEDGLSSWDVSPRPPRQPVGSQQLNFPLQAPGVTFLYTLFDLHAAYRLSRRGAKVVPSFTSPVPEAAIKEIQVAIFRSLFASSDQRGAYDDHGGPTLSPEDQAYYDSGEIDERLMLMPSSRSLKVATGRFAPRFDFTNMMAGVIEGSRIFGDVHDASGWTMPASFWSEYPLDAPPEMVQGCRGGDVNTIPPGLRGSTIKEIVLKMEDPGWRAAGPFRPNPAFDIALNWM